MEDIYIIGAGGLAKEVYILIDEINQNSSSYNVKGFVDFKPNEKDILICGLRVPIIDESYFLSNFKNVNVVNGIGSPKIINITVNKFSNYIWPNIIHPSVIDKLNKRVVLGEGNVITAGNILTTHITIGSYNFLNLNCTIGHDTIIGDANVINPGSNISGGVVVGNSNLIGTNATILQYMRIGNNNTIGASALVNKEVGNNETRIGVPARPMQNKSE